MIKAATGTSGAAGVPLAGMFQALMRSGDGPLSWDDSSLIFTDWSDPTSVVFELDDVAERDEWRRV